MKHLLRQGQLITGMATFMAISAFSSNKAMALTWSISGQFDDSPTGTITGSFDFDGSNYSNINIITSDGSFFTGGATYTDASLGSNSASGLSLSTLSSGFSSINTLDLSFDSPLTNAGGIINLAGNTESNLNPQTRNVSSGTVSASVAVPFEFSPGLGIILISSVYGISCVKKKFQSVAKIDV